jgi:hypothetical protein
MNSVTTRQQSNQRNAVQRVRIAAPKGSEAVTSANRQQAVDSLVKVLEMRPGPKEWNSAIDSVSSGLWPDFMTMPAPEQELVLAEIVEMMSAAMAIVRAGLSPQEQLLLDQLEASRDENEPAPDMTPKQKEFYFGLLYGWGWDEETKQICALHEPTRSLNAAIQEQKAQWLTIHQAAVNSLQEMAISTPDFCASFPGSRPVIPFEQVPALFRTAIEANAAGNPHPEETAIIEYALALLEQSGNVNIRTREQEEFYASLLMSLDAEGQIRIVYSPSNVTVH